MPLSVPFSMPIPLPPPILLLQHLQTVFPEGRIKRWGSYVHVCVHWICECKVVVWRGGLHFSFPSCASLTQQPAPPLDPLPFTQKNKKTQTHTPPFPSARPISFSSPSLFPLFLFTLLLALGIGRRWKQIGAATKTTVCIHTSSDANSHLGQGHRQTQQTYTYKWPALLTLPFSCSKSAYSSLSDGSIYLPPTPTRKTSSHPSSPTFSFSSIPPSHGLSLLLCVLILL